MSNRRRQADWRAVVTNRITEILGQSAPIATKLPIDPRDFCGLCGVLAIEERMMIPEAAIEPVSGGFKIYIQSNFAENSNLRLRRRFSLAHELCHTFFYDKSVNPPKRIPFSPQGEAVEALCHLGASLLLVPTQTLKRDLDRLDGPPTAHDAIELANRFDVSLETMLRSIQRATENSAIDHALILFSTQGEPSVVASYSGPWLKTTLATPHYGQSWRAFLSRAIGSADAFPMHGFVKIFPTGRLTAKVTAASKHRCILELRQEPTLI